MVRGNKVVLNAILLPLLFPLFASHIDETHVPQENKGTLPHFFQKAAFREM
jgi:hypothetical protein